MRRDPLRQIWVPAGMLLADSLIAFAALCAGWWIRYRTPLGQTFVEVRDARFADYLPLLAVGCGLLVLTFAQMGLYSAPMVLRRLQAAAIVAKGSLFWLFAYLGLSLVLRFVPDLSRLHVALSALLVVLLVGLWRQLLYLVVTRSPLLARLRQGLLVYGWNESARSLIAALSERAAHPYALVGVFARPGEEPPLALLAGSGGIAELEALLSARRVDLLVCAQGDLPAAEFGRVAALCERRWIDLKAVPGPFESLLSGLRMQVVGGVPLLGLGELAISRPLARVLKRAVDLAGAAAGLLLSVPVLFVLAFLIRRESPGAVFFAQERVGADNRRFRMWKLRSMVPGAEASDHERQSTPRDDARLLRIGRVMRRWNLDELPQFWNVLRGDMSLVGPRPERPLHADRISGEVAHYFQRHIAKPGMTGWAQVNGLRGACDLGLRVRFDHHYIENWSLWLDFQILAMTLFRWRNKAE